MTKITSAMDMLLSGWCESCDADPALCLSLGHCVYEETEEENDAEEKPV